jgi:glycosyltransferase involved in cell wall biosynthesis
MLITGFNRYVALIRKALIFYKNNGTQKTLIKIQDYIKSKIIKKHSYQSVLNKFPQKFNVTPQTYLISHKWIKVIDSAAEVALQELITLLNLSLHPSGILFALKTALAKDKYYRVLEDLFTLQQFISQPCASDMLYPLIQASQLPEVMNRTRRRRILFITSQFPNSYNGGGNRVLNFINVLSQNNDIFLSTCFIPDEDSSELKKVESYCHSVQTIPYQRFGGNQGEIRAWLNGLQMDIVHYEWPRALENYDPSFGKTQIFTYMEAVSLRLKMDLEQTQPLSPLWLDKFTELIYALRLELADAAQLAARIAVTTKDGDFFRELYPYQQYAVLNHGLAFDEFSLPDIDPEPHSMVFVGNYGHYPNVEALDFFFNEIWSDILRAIPDARIYLIGPNPPHRITQLADGKHIVVTGGVPDIRPHIQKAAIGIAPLISGAGMRGKVIDYAVLRRTFVATSLAVTDLVLKNSIDFYCADTAPEFTQKIILLLKDGKIARQMSASAFETARQNYDNYRLTDFLVRLYEYLEEQPACSRCALFSSD